MLKKMLNYRLDMLRCAQRLVIKIDDMSDRENMFENRLDMLEERQTGHVGIETDWTWWNTDRLDMEYKQTGHGMQTDWT